MCLTPLNVTLNGFPAVTVLGTFGHLYGFLLFTGQNLSTFPRLKRHYSLIYLEFNAFVLHLNKYLRLDTCTE